jgi:hypothetical protein
MMSRTQDGSETEFLSVFALFYWICFLTTVKQELVILHGKRFARTTHSEHTRACCRRNSLLCFCFLLPSNELAFGVTLLFFIFYCSWKFPGTKKEKEKETKRRLELGFRTVQNKRFC